MKLQEAIQQLVEQFGKSVIAEARLANLLADLNGYEEYPAMKPVFKEILKSGFGQKLYNTYTTNPSETKQVCGILMKQMSKEYNYKEDLIRFGFECLLLGLEATDSVNEPFSNGYDPFSKGEEDLLNNLSKLLDSLKKEYLDMLDSLITLPKDILHDAPGYFSTEAQTTLYAIESKIIAVQLEYMAYNRLPAKYDGWCKLKQNEKLAFYKKQKAEAIESRRKKKVQELDMLKTEYLTALDNLITLPKDILHDAPGYFSENALKKLYEVEAKIAAIELELAPNSAPHKNQEWCKQKRAEKLAYYKKLKDDAVESDRREKAQATLDKTREQFSDLLESSIHIFKIFGIKRSGYYDKATLERLSEIESEVQKAYANLGMPYDRWCERKLDESLAKHKVDTEKACRQALLKIGIPTVLLFILAVTGINYLTSIGDINQFEQTIDQGDKSASSGNYGQAIQLFANAKDHYDGSFRRYHYGNIANEHIASCLDAVSNDCSTFISQGKFSQASILLHSMPRKAIVQDKANTEKFNEIEAHLSEAIEKAIDGLTDNISENGGHLDAQGKEQLKELLSVAPKDYWLNFIKHKEQ